MNTKNTRAFLASVFLSFFFWLALNTGAQKLNDFFYNTTLPHNSNLASAEIVQPLPLGVVAEKPSKKADAADFQTQASAALAIFVGENGKTKTLFQKNAEQSLPIASLTKLMTALVTVQQYQLNEKITISQKAADKEEPIGNFKAGEIVSVNNLLHSLLVESSNKAAEALSSAMGDDAFLNLMNEQAHKLNLQKTFFADPAGVDPNNPNDPTNVSSARDLFTLLKTMKEQYPQTLSILSLQSYPIKAFNPATQKELTHHIAKNTNELLGISNPFLVTAGKTGWTPEANGCLLLVAKSPQNGGYIVSIVLGSSDRFQDTKNLLAWIANSYEF